MCQNVPNMNITIEKTIREKFVNLYPASVQPLVEAALPELELQAARLGMEVLHVEGSGVDFSEAVDRPADWPLMSRVHHGLLDILQLEMPPEAQAILSTVIANCEYWDGIEDLRRLIVCRAANDDDRADCALARFALYQIIRLNLWAASWDAPEVEALGCMAQLDREAEGRLRERLSQQELFDEDVRPLHVLVADALCHLLQHFEVIRDETRTLGPDLARLIEGLINATGLARQLGAADAAILRNDYAKHIGGTTLGSVQLSEQHPLVLPTQGAVDTRRARLKSKLPEPPRVRTRLLDLFRDA